MSGGHDRHLTSVKVHTSCLARPRLPQPIIQSCDLSLGRPGDEATVNANINEGGCYNYTKKPFARMMYIYT